MSYLNERIKKARKERRLTQVEVANYLEISDRMYQRYEKDIEPSLETIQRLNQLFGVDLINEAPFSPTDEMNFERSAIKALSFAFAKQAMEIAVLKGEKPRTINEYLDEIDENTNLILAGLRMSGKKGE